VSPKIRHHLIIKGRSLLPLMSERPSLYPQGLLFMAAPEGSIWRAARDGDEARLRSLAEAYGDVSVGLWVEDARGQTPLDWACEGRGEGMAAVMRLIADDLASRQQDLTTRQQSALDRALATAIGVWRAEVVGPLLRVGADPLNGKYMAHGRSVWETVKEYAEGERERAEESGREVPAGVWGCWELVNVSRGPTHLYQVIDMFIITQQ
jgi:hypothetical protein